MKKIKLVGINGFLGGRPQKRSFYHITFMVRTCREPVCFKSGKCDSAYVWRPYRSEVAGRSQTLKLGFPVGIRPRKCIQTVLTCSC